MPVSCCQGPRRPSLLSAAERIEATQPFMVADGMMNGPSSCCQMLLARVRYKKFSPPSLAGKFVIASRAQAATSSNFTAGITGGFRDPAA